MLVKAASILLTILKVLVILAIMFIVVRCLKKVLKKVEANKKVLTKQKGQIGWKLASNAAIVAAYALGIIAAVNQVPSISAALTTVLAGSGILAVIVGFAAQESFGNLVSGVFLSLFHPFGVGNRVTLVAQGITGDIEDITLRHTVIRTISGTRMLVPNSIMGSAIVENANFEEGEPVCGFIDISVGYDADLDKAMKLMSEVIASHPSYVGAAQPGITLRSFGASGIDLRGVMATATVAQNVPACSETRLKLKKTFDENGITIPFQTITIAGGALDVHQA